MKFLNKLFVLLITIIIVFFCYTDVSAATKIGYVDATSGLTIRKDAGTTYSKVGSFKHKTTVTITSSKETSDKSTGCPTKIWYYASDGKLSGYVCSQYIIITDNGETTPSEMAQMTESQFEEYLEKQGFPTSYWDKLKTLHKTHPNWVFKGVKAKYTWSNALDQENVKGRSLYQVNSTGVKNGLQGYLNTESTYYDYATDKFKALDGSTWFQANKETIAYYMDPRNFLTESGIFMFEDLTYYESYQTSEVVKKILYTDFYKEYINYYIEAAKKYNVSPVYLAALSRQEVGLNSSTATSGKAGTYNNVNYNGYYNFYNIGATSGKNPVYNGLDYAKEANWNSPQTAIIEGAQWIVNGYISKGQYTRYFQKWNVSPTTTTGIWHQYMTDIRALVSPAATTAASYNSMGINNEALVFSIPIYIGMPVKTELPSTGNPNNWLKSLSVDSKSIENFKSDITTYDLGTVDYSKNTLEISATTINSNASIDGDGKINLSVGKNTLKIIVTAQNGNQKTYTLTVTRKENPVPEPPKEEEISISKILSNLSIKNNNNNVYGFKVGTLATNISQDILKQNVNGKATITTSDGKAKTNSSLATGDKITITSNNETKTYQVVIYGDISGDGLINAKDLLLLRKYLLKEKNLTDSYLESANLDRASSINAKDLLILRKYLLGTISISQV